MPEMDGFMLAGEIMRRPGLEGTPLIMLTSAGQTRDCERRRALGIAACLTKPVKQSELLRAIITTLSKSLPVAARPPQAPHSAPIKKGKTMRILLAEDNIINQRLAVRLLEKQGHEVVVANNGSEAIAALEREPFDLALMDVQMPEMSGLEATARIRERERATGARLPIIALTAYAMKGDRERCLEAGMDGYVSKPIRSEDLFQAIAEATPVSAEGSDPAPLGEGQSEVFDQAKALEVMGDDRELLAELAELFAEDCPRRLTEIRQAITERKSERVERAAHTLKGTASNFGARATVAAARRLEEMGCSRDWPEVEAAYDALETEIKRLTAALGAFGAQHLGEKSVGNKAVVTHNGNTEPRYEIIHQAAD
jgi:CheY-like chemotaxis protein/HPt (histidine-containing phosphotransfer) domain-containing protein